MDAILLGALICGVIGYFIDNTRGAILGALLGVIGLIISAILRACDKKG